jgi:serine/threonine protein kinase
LPYTRTVPQTSDVPPDLQAALADRYTLNRVLGRGGMATVYLAHDRKHERDVAIKVLRPDLAASLGAERFLKEIQIAARLTHPHILALYDSGKAVVPPLHGVERGPGGEAFLYYVMPFVEGATLRQRLLANRRLDPVDALAIARPVADALSYAHRMGIFHRDIKPENVLFSQGHPVVGDFGIAKAIITAGTTNLTRTGFPVGTPGYMSPEQAAGLTDLDERTDVYSLAVVIYEMLVGDLPGRWPSEEAARTGRFLDAPAAHRARLTQTGATIEAALVRGMAIRYEQRTPTPAALIDELTGRAPGALVPVAPPPPPPRRQFSGDEVRDIVNRAAELEATSPTVGGAMTIGGVERLAAEVSIDPAMVRKAAASLAARATPSAPLATPKPNLVIGGPTRLVFERIVQGEVPDTEFATMVEEVRRVMQNVGQVSQLGRSFSWSMSRGGSGRRDLEVLVSVRAGVTRITIQENLALVIGQIFGGIGGGLGGGGMGPIMGIFVGAMHMHPAYLLGVIPAWLTTVYVTARTVYGRSWKSRARELENLADRLERLARELVT